MKWLEGIAKNLSDAAENAKTSTKELLEITRLKNDINDQERYISRLKTQIGEKVFEDYTKAERDYSQTLLHFCEEIESAKEKIAGLQERISEIKNADKDGAVDTTAAAVPEEEKRLCPDCGRELDRADRFCRSCGRDLQKDEAEPCSC